MEWQHTETSPILPMTSTYRISFKILSASSYRSKSTTRYPSLPPLPLCNVLVPRSDQTMARLPPSTPTCPFYATSSFIMFEISPSSTRQEKKNSGRISFRWYVGNPGQLREASLNLQQSSFSSHSQTSTFLPQRIVWRRPRGGNLPSRPESWWS